MSEKEKNNDFKLFDPKNKNFNLLAAFGAAVFIGSWSMVKNVEEKIADVAKREVTSIERDVEILKLRIDSLGVLDDKSSRDVKEYCRENIERLEKRITYVERRTINPFKNR